MYRKTRGKGFFFLRSIINQLHLKYYFHETTFKNILVILL